MCKISVVFLSVLVISCAYAPEKPEKTEGDDYAYTMAKIAWMIENKMLQHDVIGLSIAIVDGQELVWAKGFGYSDKENRVLATEDTVYRIGSITKVFTALAAMQLHERNVLDLNAPIASYLPRLNLKSRFHADSYPSAKNIMSHHSGLPSDRVNGMWGAGGEQQMDLATQLNGEFLSFEPGTVESYSNLGYSLLGNAISQSTNPSYEQYLKENIFNPINMKQTFVDSSLSPSMMNSRGYFNGKVESSVHLRDLPAGGINSSVKDLAKFTSMIFATGQIDGVTVLKTQNVNAMMEPQDGKVKLDINKNNGLGWFIDHSFGEAAGKLIRHNGGTPLFSSELVAIPKHKLGVIVLSNSNTGAQIVSEIAEEALRLALESKTGIKTARDKVIGEAQDARKRDLVKFDGVWSSQIGTIEIEPDGDALSLVVDNTELDLVHRGDGIYYPQYKLLGLIPVSLGRFDQIGIEYMERSGHQLLVAKTIDGRQILFAEKVAKAPLLKSWEGLIGEYELLNPSGSIEIAKAEVRYTNEILKLDVEVSITPGTSEKFTMCLEAIDDDHAVISGLGRSKGDTLAFSRNDGQIIMNYSGFVLKKKQR